MKKILKETLIKNIELLESNLVIQTFGNLSIKIDEKKINFIFSIVSRS